MVVVVVVVVVVVLVVLVVLVVRVVGKCYLVALVPLWLLGSRARVNDTRGGSCFARANPELMLLLYCLCCWIIRARPSETRWSEVVFLLLPFFLLLCVGKIALVVC